MLLPAIRPKRRTLLLFALRPMYPFSHMLMALATALAPYLRKLDKCLDNYRVGDHCSTGEHKAHNGSSNGLDGLAKGEYTVNNGYLPFSFAVLL